MGSKLGGRRQFSGSAPKSKVFPATYRGIPVTPCTANGSIAVLLAVGPEIVTLDKPLNFQFAALPYRRRPDFTLEVMLITSRDTGRWVVPKGWANKRETAWDCAAREAREEAGLIGQIEKRPLGSYHYKKPLDDGLQVWCTVEVFPFRVLERHDAWPEQNQRAARWFSLDDAATVVEEPELTMLIRSLPQHVSR